MTTAEFLSQYGGWTLAAIVTVWIGIIAFKRKKAIIGAPRPATIDPPPIRDISSLDTIQDLDALTEPRSVVNATQDAVKLLATKRNIIRQELINHKKTTKDELNKVAKTQKEIYDMVQLLIKYYKDLQQKQRVLEINLSGLTENEQNNN